MALEKTLQQNFTQKTLQTKLIIQLWLSKKTLQTNFTKRNFTNQSSSCGSRRKHEVPRDARAERKQVGLKKIKKELTKYFYLVLKIKQITLKIF